MLRLVCHISVFLQMLTSRVYSILLSCRTTMDTMWSKTATMAQAIRRHSTLMWPTPPTGVRPSSRLTSRRLVPIRARMAEACSWDTRPIATLTSCIAGRLSARTRTGGYSMAVDYQGVHRAAQASTRSHHSVVFPRISHDISHIAPFQACAGTFSAMDPSRPSSPGDHRAAPLRQHGPVLVRARQER